MMKHLLVLLIQLTSLAAMAGTPFEVLQQASQTSAVSLRTTSIDASDSVLIDLDNFVKNGNDISVPVFILTDVTIYSLDFSFKYNHVNVEYDTMVNLASYIQPLYYYNSVDSTVRFTSFGSQAYAHGTNLVYVHFNLLAWQLISTDLFSMNAYLNGDPCSFAVIGGIPSGIEDIQAENVRVFPNPSNGETLHAFLPFEAEAQFMDIAGKQLSVYSVAAGSDLQIPTAGLNSGIYLLKFRTGKQAFVRTVVIQ